METAMETFDTDCCIAGGGPAGMMLGLLLARAGVRVTVLEKHADFLRDFRGDTIHPSTLEVMAELGLLDALLAIPHGTIERLSMQWEDRVLPMADFTHLPTRCKFIALMPQWDLLDLLARAGAGYPGYALRMKTEARELIGERAADGAWTRIDGLHATGPAGDVEIRAKLVVACDGRRSRMREVSGLAVDSLGAPMDVVWFKLPRRDGDGEPPLGRFTHGAIFVLIDRGDHWQCGFVIAKGSIDNLRAKGFDAFKDAVVATMPSMISDARERVATLHGWDDVSLLSVTVDRLRQWAIDGLLCIGDAAHAMSPVGGVGINLAIQDAVATANLLQDILVARRPTLADLDHVQARREWPAKATQSAQVAVQKQVIARALAASTETAPPLPFRVVSHVGVLRALAARMVGLGVRPELPKALDR
jgi:2-polyprenyl-6-methoxyphenol hydroxylase-like FAD-dependent oxidoreductase